jgi:hypothetical protein
MKQFFFLFTMLTSIVASAQNAQVESISATYTSTPIVKFRVAWTGVRTYRHNTKVWVFVDYRKVANNAPAGDWTRASVTATPAVSSSHASTITLEPGNDKGFWLHGANGDYSATLTVPVTLAAGVSQFNWCAYATDYPPNVVAHSNSSYTLRGSRPFIVNGSTLSTNQTTFSGTINSFTDATGAPGIFPAASGQKTNEMGCLHGLVENASSVCVAPSDVGCNNTILNLGTVSFSAGTEITITGDNLSQIWSRPVTATGCQKTSYNGGSSVNVNADCRNNPGYPGDLFSACAVHKYANQICPYPWRVPTMSDYTRLVHALGGSLNDCSQNIIPNKMVNIWGGVLAGETTDMGSLNLNSICGMYRTSSARYGYAYGFRICVGLSTAGGCLLDSVEPYPHYGWVIRCVKTN